MVREREMEGRRKSHKKWKRQKQKETDRQTKERRGNGHRDIGRKTERKDTQG